MRIISLPMRWSVLSEIVCWKNKGEEAEQIVSAVTE